MSMADKGYEFNYHALDALVKDFLRAYSSLGGESLKRTQGVLDKMTADTLHVGMNAKPVTPPSVFFQEDIIQPLTPRFEGLETMVVNHAESRLPQASLVTSLHALNSGESLPKPLTSRFEEVEAEVAGQLELELPRLLEDDVEAFDTRKVSLRPPVSESRSLISAFSSFQVRQQESLVKLSGTEGCGGKSKNLQNLLRIADKERFNFSDALLSPMMKRRRRCEMVFEQCWRWCIDTSKKEMVAQSLDPVMCVMIVINCILTAVSFDTDEWSGWYFFECFFAGLYTIEICLKITLFGWREVYFGHLWAWSLFDTLIAILAIVDLFSRFSGAVTTFRVLRLLRLLRVMRLARLSMLKEMNMLVRGMMGGASCLFWCIVFLSLPILLIGMILSQELKDWDDELFSSVPASMFTTLRCMCGDCTDKQGRPLFLLIASQRGWSFAMFYSIFVLVTMFGVLNLITAFFIETTMLATKSDSILQSQIREADDRKFAKNIKKLIFWFWINHTDRHTKILGQNKKNSLEPRNRRDWESKEFHQFVLEDALDLAIDEDFYQQQVNTPEIREVLADMGLPDEDIVDLFDMLDVDKSGTLDLTELVTGLHKLRGDARKHDLVGLVYIIYSAQERILRELQRCAGSMALSASEHGPSQRYGSTDSRATSRAQASVLVEAPK